MMNNHGHFFSHAALLLDHLTDPIFVKDPQHTFVYANQAFAELLGKSFEEFIGKNDNDFFPRELVDVYWREDDRVIQTGHESHQEEDALQRDGTVVRLLTKKIRVEFNGQFYLLGILRDITEMARATRLSHLGEIAAGLSHEMMTPLTVMDFHLSHARSKLQGQGELKVTEVEALLTNLEKSKDRLINTMRSVREFSRDLGVVPSGEASLAAILQEVVELTQPRLQKHNCLLRLPEKLPVESLVCRSPQIVQILTNLIHNGADAVADLSERWVELRLEKHGSDLEFLVLDAGLGIPPAQAVKLMNPFYTTKPAGAGTGLGLSLAAKMAIQHRGELRYDPTSPHTCFRLRLPLSV